MNECSRIKKISMVFCWVVDDSGGCLVPVCWPLHSQNPCDLWGAGIDWQQSWTSHMFYTVVTSRVPVSGCALYCLLWQTDATGSSHHKSTDFSHTSSYPGQNLYVSFLCMCMCVGTCMSVCIAGVQGCLNCPYCPKRLWDWRRAPEWSSCEQVLSITANAFSLICWLSSTHLSTDQ